MAAGRRVVPAARQPFRFAQCLWLGLSLLAGLAARLYRLGDQNVWWDEGLAAWAARLPLAASARWTAADVHPPLYFWLLHFWRLASGESEWGLRLLSALIGVVTIALAYRLGRQAGGRRSGVLAAALLAGSRFAVTWSQEMRMYALAALLTTLGLWAALRVWERGRGRDWALYICAMTAGLYTLYLFALGLFIINGLALGHIVRAGPRWARLFWRWTGAQALILALFAPWLWYALGRIPTWSAATPVEPWTFIKIYASVLALGAPDHVEAWAGWTLSLWAVFGLGLLAILADCRRPRQRATLALLALALSLPALVVYLVSLPRTFFFYSPPLAPRYLLLFVGAYASLLAWGLARLARRHWALGLAGMLVAFSITGRGLLDYYPGRQLSDDYRSLSQALSALRQPDETVVLVTDQDWPLFAYHYPADWTGLPAAWQLTPEQAQAFLSPLWQARAGLWLVVTPYAGVSDPQDELGAWLRARAAGSVEYRFGDKRLVFYARDPARRPAAQGQLWRAPELRFAAAGPLGGWDWALNEYRPGDALTLFLRLKPPAAASEVRLLDPAGQVRAAQPVGPAEAPAPYGLWRQVDFSLSPDDPPGRYQLEWQSAGETLTLGAFQLRANGAAPVSAGEVKIQHPLNAALEGGIHLLGYDLDAQNFQPGGVLRLTLYWQADQPPTARYKVFTHLRGSEYNLATGNPLWGQQDNEPVTNFRPTTTWRSGEVIVDPYALAVDPQAPAGAYVVEIGLYDPASGARLAWLDPSGAKAGDAYELPVNLP